MSHRSQQRHEREAMLVRAAFMVTYNALLHALNVKDVSRAQLATLRKELESIACGQSTALPTPAEMNQFTGEDLGEERRKDVAEGERDCARYIALSYWKVDAYG